MKKFSVILPLMILVMGGMALTARAACTLGAGAVCVVLQDSLGASVVGDTSTLVSITFEGTDGDLLSLPNTIWNNVVDGGAQDDDGVADGDIELSMAHVSAQVTSTDASDWYYSIVSTSGFVNQISANLDYDETHASTNTTTATLEYTLKVTIKNEIFGDVLPGGNITVTGATSPSDCNAVYGDNGPKDKDSTVGVIQIACAADSSADPVSVKVHYDGFLDYTDATHSISNGSQLEIVSENDFPYVITAQDELGGVVTLTNGNTVTGLSLVMSKSNGGTLYLAATGGPSQITISEPGYIQETTTTGPYTYSASGVQTALTFQAAGNGPALPFGFIVTAQNEADGAAVTLAAGATVSGTGLTVITTSFNGGNAYVAASGGPGTFTLATPGYITTTTGGNWTYDDTTQQTVNFDGSGAPDGAQLPYALKVVVYDEAGGAANGCTVTHGGTAVANTVGNAYYFTTTAAGALVVSKAGYVTINSGNNTELSSIQVGSTDQGVITVGVNGALGETVCNGTHTAGADITCSGLKFPLRLVVEDEFGDTTNMTALAPTFQGGGATHPAGTNRYFWTNDGVAGGVLSVPASGYVTMDNTQDTSLNQISTNAATGQTDIFMSGATALNSAIAAGSSVTVKGVMFAFVISAQDELGNTLTLTMANSPMTLASLTQVALNERSGSLYLAATGGPGTVRLETYGYVRETSNAFTYNAAAQQTIDFDGTDGTALPFAFVISATDELTNALTLTTANSPITLSGLTQVDLRDSGGSLYLAATGGPGTVLIETSGYVRETSNAFTYDNSTQQTIDFDGTDGTRLPFAFIITAQDELGNALTLTTGNTAATLTGLTQVALDDNGGNLYLAASGAGTIRLDPNNGYVQETTAGSWTYDNTTQQVVNFDGSGAPDGPALPFAFKITAQDELSNTLSLTIANSPITLAGIVQVDLQESGGALYLAATGGPGTVRLETSGYVRETSNAFTYDNTTQQTIDFDGTDGTKLPFAFVISAQDELGNTLTLTTANSPLTLTTLTQVALDDSAGKLYLAATGGPGTVRLETYGYVRETSNAFTYDNTVQQTIDFDGTDGTALPFAFVISANDELGNAMTLTAAGATFALTGLTQVDLKDDGSDLYLAATGAGTMQLTMDGYVTETTAGSWTYDNTTQQTVNFDGSGSPDGPALAFGFKITAQDELGNALTLNAVDSTITLGGTLTQVDLQYNAGTAYLAATGAGAITVGQQGYVDKASASYTYSSAAQQTVAFTGTTGLPFGFKITAADELGNAITLSAVNTTFTLGGTLVQVDLQYSGGTAYLAATGAGTLTLSQLGYIDTVSAAQTYVSTAQTAVAFTGATGLPFAFTITANDELGNAVTLTTTNSALTLTGLTQVDLKSSGGTLYFAATGGPGTIRLETQGYVRETTAGNWTYNPAAQQAVAFDGSGAPDGPALPFAFIIAANDELGNALTLTTVNSTLALTGLTQVDLKDNGGSLYLAATGAGTIQLTMQGYARETTLGTWTYDNTTQQTVNFDGSGTPDGAALPFAFKIAANDELGNALTLTTGNTAVTLTGLVQVDLQDNGGTLYLAATGAGTIRLDPNNGYIQKTTLGTWTYSSAAQQTVNFDGSGTPDGPALPFAFKITAQDELSNTLTLTTANSPITLTGLVQVDLQDNGGALYLAATGGPGSVRLETDGYVRETSSNFTYDNTAQQTIDFDGTDGTKLPFAFVISAQDELGDTLTLTTANSPITLTGLTQVALDDSTGKLYLAATGGPGSVRLETLGYVRETTTLGTWTYDNTTQQTIDFDGTDGTALPFAFVVSAQDELTNALTLTTTTSALTLTSLTQVALKDNGGLLYLAATGGPGTVRLETQGYVRETTTASWTYDNTTQQTLDFDGTDGTALPFAFKINANDELGNALTLATGTDGVSLTGLTQVALDDNAGALYLAATGTGYIRVDPNNGYVHATTVGTWTYDITTQQTVNFDGSGTPDGPGLPFAFRIAANDELGNTLSLTTATSAIVLTGLAQVDLRNNGGYLYLAATGGPGTVRLTTQGYVQETTLGNWTYDSTAQQYINFDGSGAPDGAALPFAFKITAIDELDNALTLTTANTPVTLTGLTQVDLRDSGGSLYLAATGGPGTVRIDPTGYVQETTAGNWTYNAAAQQTINFDGSGAPDGAKIPFAFVVSANDELGNALTLTTTTSALTLTSLTQVALDDSGGSLYLAATGGPGSVRLETQGYVQETTTAATWTYDNTTQQMVDFDGTDGTALPFAFVINANDELGNALTLTTGADGVSLTGLTQVALDDNAGALYLAATGTGYIRVDPNNGYVRTTTAGTWAYDITTQQTVNFDGSGSPDGPGLPFAFTISANDELGNVLSLTTATSAIVLTGLAQTDLRNSGGKLYLAATGGPGTVRLTTQGYVQETTLGNWTYDSTDQQDIYFDGSGAPDGAALPFAFKITAIDELDNALTLTTANTPVTLTGLTQVALDDSGGSLYLAATGGPGTVRIEPTGYVQETTGGNWTYNTAAQQTINFDGSVAPDGSKIPFAFRITADDELGNVLTLTSALSSLSGASLTVVDTRSNAGALYVAGTTSGAGAFVLRHNAGYVDSTTTAATWVYDNTAQQALAFDGTDAPALPFAFLITATDELTNSLTLTAANTTVTPGGGMTQTALQYSGGTGYLAATGSATIALDKQGYVDKTSATQTYDPAAQQTVAFAGATALPFGFKILAYDELGNSVALSAASSTFTLGGTLSQVDLQYDSGTAYIAATGAGAFTLRQTGYVDSTSASYTYSAAAQTQFSYDSSTALKYALKVAVFDEMGRAVTGCTMTHGGTAPVLANQGPSSNLYYFSTAGQANLAVIRSGFVSLGVAPDFNFVTPGGGAVSQTYIELTGSGHGSIGTVAGGEYKLADGLKYATNVELKVSYYGATTGLTGLGNLTNFYFEDGVGVRVTPTVFYEVDPTNMPGVYEFKVPTTTTKVTIKDVDFDGDPWVDFDDSAPLDLGVLTDDTLATFATISLNFAVDHVMLSAAPQSFEAGSSLPVTVTLFNNDGATITAGLHATDEITFKLAGGSTSPASQKDIVSTTLTDTTLSSASGIRYISGRPVAGTGSVTIYDTVITNGSDLLVSAYPKVGTYPQQFASNTTNLPISVVTSPATKIIIMNPADVTTDDAAAVTIQIQDVHGNVVATDTRFLVHVSGSAKIMSSTPTGHVLTGVGTATSTVEVVDGTITLSVEDTVAETVTITVDDSMDYGLADTSVQDVVFSPGAEAEVVFITPVPTSQTVGADITVGAKVVDTHGNTVTSSSAVFTLTATGSGGTASGAMFTGVTAPATIISGEDTKSIAVQASGGVVSATLTDTLAETVVLSIEGTSLGTGASKNVTFVPGTADKLVLMYNDADLALTAGTMSANGYIVQVQDSNGNPSGSLSSPRSAELIVNLASSHSTTGKFYASVSGTIAITTVTIPTTSNTAVFYYRDTLATTSSAATITVSGTDVTSAQISVTIAPSTPVTGYTVTTSSATTDSEQPTGFKYTQSISISDTDGSRTLSNLVEYPYTSASDTQEQIVANGAERGIIRIKATDMYGNVLSGAAVSFATTIGGVTKTDMITPSTTYTDSSGEAQVTISSTTVGDASVTARVTVGSVAYTYGSAFTVRFKMDDRTPPDIVRYSGDDAALMDGDRVNPAGPIRVHVTLSDTGTNASGVNLSSIAVSVKRSDTQSTMSGYTSLASCVYQSDCTVEWTPYSTLSAGTYEVTLNVSDNNSNVQTMVFTVVVEGGSELKEIKVGPAVFNPRSGEKLQIGFQSPLDGVVVRLEIYDRSGKMIYSSTKTVYAGFDSFEWDGRDFAGALPGNGIYVFRLVSNIGGRGVEQKGKLMIYKR